MYCKILVKHKLGETESGFKIATNIKRTQTGTLKQGNFLVPLDGCVTFTYRQNYRQIATQRNESDSKITTNIKRIHTGTFRHN